MRLVAHAGRGELIDRRAAVNIRAIRLARLRAGEKGRHRPRVIACAVAVRASLVRGEAGEHEQIFLKRPTPKTCK